MNRIVDYRLGQGRTILLGSLMTYSANVALSQANYQEGRWTTRIGGQPFTIWARAIYGTNRAAVIMTTLKRRDGSLRCWGRPYTSFMAFRSLIRNQYYRSWLLWDGFFYGSVRMVTIHRHKGFWKGKGECSAYYVSLSS